MNKQLQYELGEPADPIRTITAPLYVLGGLVVLGVLFGAVREAVAEVAATREMFRDDDE